MKDTLDVFLNNLCLIIGYIIYTFKMISFSCFIFVQCFGLFTYSTDTTWFVMKKIGVNSKSVYEKSTGSLFLIDLCRTMARSIILTYCIQYWAVFPLSPFNVWSTNTSYFSKDLLKSTLFSLKSNSSSDKNTEKWAKMKKFTPPAKVLHCRRQWRQWQIAPLCQY